MKLSVDRIDKLSELSKLRGKLHPPYLLECFYCERFIDGPDDKASLM